MQKGYIKRKTLDDHFFINDLKYVNKKEADRNRTAKL
jgi:hypothetical protein